MLSPKLNLKPSSNRARPRRFPSWTGTCRALGLLGAVATLILLVPTLVSATIVTADTSRRIFGDIVTATLTIDDESQAGNLVITLSLDPGPLTGDLRSFYAQIADESLLSGLSISGVDVTQSRVEANSVFDFGDGTFVPTIPTACGPTRCDFGFEIGTAGTSPDNIQTTIFVLSHLTEVLTVDVLADQVFALRVNSISSDGSRGVFTGFSKLVGVITVVPEPSTAIMMMLGLAGLTVAGGRDQSRKIEHPRH